MFVCRPGASIKRGQEVMASHGLLVNSSNEYSLWMSPTWRYGGVRSRERPCAPAVGPFCLFTTQSWNLKLTEPQPSRSSDFETSRLRRWPRFTGQAIAFKSSYTLVVCLFSISSFSCVLSLSFFHCSFSNTTLFQTQKLAHRSMASLFSG